MTTTTPQTASKTAVELTVTYGPTTRTIHPDQTLLLGRGSDCDVPLMEPGTSRRHAELSHDGSAWVLRDLGSRHGMHLGTTQLRVLRLRGPVRVTLGPTDGSGAELELVPGTDEQHPTPVENADDPAGATGVHGSVIPAVPPLVLTAGTATVTVHAGTTATVGRGADCTLTVHHPLVSRMHGRVEVVGGRWTYTDTSRLGTFIAGRKVEEPIPVTAATALRLADPSTGAELRLNPGGKLPTPSLVSTVGRRPLAVVVAVLAVVFALVGVTLTRTAGAAQVAPRTTAADSRQSAADASRQALENAKRATVKLADDADGSWGSGTIISADGLILTNAHVAAPASPGRGITHAPHVTPFERGTRNPEYLTVWTTGPDGTVKPAYRASVVVADGYLDLAVLRIDATSEGKELPASGLHLPAIPIGDSHQVRAGDPLTVLGFPGIADSDEINVTRGVISTFVPEPLKRTHSDRWEIETDARIAHGNSGGAAIDEHGRLVGVPSSNRQANGDTSWRARAIELAKPLIERAVKGNAGGYVTPYAVASTGMEKVTMLGFSSTEPSSCEQTGAAIPADSSVYLVLGMEGVAMGEDVGFVLMDADGGSYSRTFVHEDGDCTVIPLDGSVAAGEYVLAIYAGPLMQQVDAYRVQAVA